MGRNKRGAARVVAGMGDAIDKIRRVETWARAGYAARGVVYLIVGALVLLTGRGAVGRGGGRAGVGIAVGLGDARRAGAGDDRLRRCSGCTTR